MSQTGGFKLLQECVAHEAEDACARFIFMCPECSSVVRCAECSFFPRGAVGFRSDRKVVCSGELLEFECLLVLLLGVVAE